MLTQGRMMITHDFVECFLKHGANVNFQDKDDYTALHSATRWGYTAIFDKFLSHKGLQPQNNHYFINRLKCSKEERYNALELLDAAVANDLDTKDTNKAFWYIKC
ncbi:hypothetical protein pdam_00019678 [Pocillopora damicornis]|uniref:Uncharacterized protein n=1 Tax=Pocillopora damicornis TaxID=46731 RepID=A0A3M6UN18_POCDA|nr:hypothetical protein pdam_00019678 [Pocillopora damicornis]